MMIEMIMNECLWKTAPKLDHKSCFFSLYFELVRIIYYEENKFGT